MTDQNRDMGKDQVPKDGMGQGPEDMSHGLGQGPAGEGSLKGAISDTRDSHGQPEMTGPEGKRSWQSVESESVDSDDDTAEANQSREERQTPR